MIYLINQIFKAIFPTCFFSPFAKFNDKKGIIITINKAPLLTMIMFNL